MRKSLNIAVSAAVALAFAASSMSVSAATRASAGAPKLQKGVTLTVWDYFGNEKNNPERLAMEASIKSWETKTGIKVNFAGNPGSTNTKMCQAGPTGNGPDLIGVPHDQLSVMFACKTLAPVPTWAWPASVQSRYIKESVLATTISGKQYAMPWAVETTGIFYNKSLISPSFFKTAPKTYLTWSKVIAKVKSLEGGNPGKPELGWDIGNLYYDYAFISGGGGYVFKPTKSGFNWQQIGLDTPGSIKGITLIKNMTTTGTYKIIPSTMNDDTASGLFESGKMAMYISGPWNEAAFQKANINYGFAPDPSIDGKHPSKPFSGVQVFAVNKYSKHSNEAFALLSYMTRQMQIREFKTSGRIPVLKSVLASKAIQSDPIAKGLAAAALAASPMPNIPEMNQVWTPAGNAITAVLKGQASPSAAMKAAVTQIKADIAKAHGG